MAQKQWKSNWNYEPRIKYYAFDGYTKEQYEETKTVPNQSQSVKEILERYEKGRPIPQE